MSQWQRFTQVLFSKVDLDGWKSEFGLGRAAVSPQSQSAGPGADKSSTGSGHAQKKASVERDRLFANLVEAFACSHRLSQRTLSLFRLFAVMRELDFSLRQAGHFLEMWPDISPKLQALLKTFAKKALKDSTAFGNLIDKLDSDKALQSDLAHIEVTFVVTHGGFDRIADAMRRLDKPMGACTDDAPGPPRRAQPTPPRESATAARDNHLVPHHDSRPFTHLFGMALNIDRECGGTYCSDVQRLYDKHMAPVWAYDNVPALQTEVAHLIEACQSVLEMVKHEIQHYLDAEEKSFAPKLRLGEEELQKGSLGFRDVFRDYNSEYWKGCVVPR